MATLDEIPSLRSDRRMNGTSNLRVLHLQKLKGVRWRGQTTWSTAENQGISKGVKVPG